MKKLNTVLAASALGLVAAQSQAALLSISVESTNVTSGAVTGSIESTGTGTLDDVTGAINWSSTVLAETNAGPGGIITATGAFITTDTFLQLTSAPDANGILSGTQVATTIACTESGTGLLFTTCGNQPVGSVVTTPVTIQALGNEFSYTTTSVTGEGGTAVTIVASTTITVGGPVSEVPVPAAAWLFGSALVGLAGIGRKRK